jgi:hypothetical protein
VYSSKASTSKNKTLLEFQCFNNSINNNTQCRLFPTNNSLSNSISLASLFQKNGNSNQPRMNFQITSRHEKPHRPPFFPRQPNINFLHRNLKKRWKRDMQKGMIKTFQLSFPLNYVSSVSNSLAFSGLLKEGATKGGKRFATLIMKHWKNIMNKLMRSNDVDLTTRKHV